MHISKQVGAQIYPPDARVVHIQSHSSAGRKSPYRQAKRFPKGGPVKHIVGILAHNSKSRPATTAIPSYIPSHSPFHSPFKHIPHNLLQNANAKPSWQLFPLSKETRMDRDQAGHIKGENMPKCHSQACAKYVVVIVIVVVR